MVLYKKIWLVLVLFFATSIGLSFAAVPKVDMVKEIKEPAYTISADIMLKNKRRFYLIPTNTNDSLLYLDSKSIKVLTNDENKRSLQCKAISVIKSGILSVVEFKYEYDMKNMPTMYFQTKAAYVYSWEGDYLGGEEVKQKERLAKPDTPGYTIGNLAYMDGFDEIYDQKWGDEVVADAKVKNK